MDPQALRAALPRTWTAFFGRHGSFTPAQLAAIPAVLAEENVLLCAATASGKTEAALAPLVERLLLPHRPADTLSLLYLLPTRALINDLWTRLQPPLAALHISCALKTHDLTTFDPQRPADILLTTPESLDALLAGHAKLLSGVRAVVVDEMHVFEGTVRGDQLRVLLNRLRQLRAYAHSRGDAASGAVQFIGLSATMSQPEAAARQYFGEARVVQVPGARPIDAELIALERGSSAALLDFLGTFRRRGWRKALLFCNTRDELESYAAALRSAGTPFGSAIYVHYSNLEWERRREIEGAFAQSQVALCLASSTLELGIDIGGVDVTLLVGAPGSRAAFLQRVGRAGRKQRRSQVACFYRTPMERLIFSALLEGQDQASPASATPFRPAVAVQQIFSLLQQSPTGGVRLNSLAALFEGMLSASDIEAILGFLQAQGYLQSGRHGEWRAGERLNRLMDLQSAEYNTLSLHSNIQTSGASQIKVRDHASRRVIASVDRQFFMRETLTLEGHALNVQWYDGESVWVSASPHSDATPLRYRSTRQLLSYELARLLAAHLGLPPNSAPLVPHEDGTLLFHWLGDLYGRALLDLLRGVLPVDDTSQPGLCLLLLDEPRMLPLFTEAAVEQYLRDHFRRYEPLLELGAYQHLLPLALRRRSVAEQFDAARFVLALQELRMERAPTGSWSEVAYALAGV